MIQPNQRDFSVFAEHNDSAMALVHREGQFLWVNPAYELLTGYSASELLLRTWMSITDPDDVPHDLAMVGQILSGQRESFDMNKTYLRKGGGTASVHLQVVGVFEDEEFQHFCVYATERRAMVMVSPEGQITGPKEGVEQVEILSVIPWKRIISAVLVAISAVSTTAWSWVGNIEKSIEEGKQNDARLEKKFDRMDRNLDTIIRHLQRDK